MDEIKNNQSKQNELQEYINRENEKDIEELYQHAKVANEEMGDIKTRLTVVEDRVITAVKQNWFIITLIIAEAIAIILKR